MLDVKLAYVDHSFGSSTMEYTYISVERVTLIRSTKDISSGAMQTNAERPFMSVVIGNAFGTTYSGATHSDRAVHGDANLVQICARFASLRTLSGPAKCPLGPRTGPPGRDTTASSSAALLASGAAAFARPR
jgi:hypothetical protein